MSEFPVFISYAHIDDEPLPPDVDGWISKFHGALETRLRQVAGRDLKVWRDDRLAGNEFFWDTIEKRLGDGGILVSILTPRYVQSPSCRREVQGYSELFKKKRGSLRVRDRSPIFKVVKTPCEPANLPAELNEVLDYPFYQLKPNGVARELTIDLSPDDRCRYFDRLYDLAHDIHEMMNLLDKGEDTAPPPKGTVFLAETSYDVAAQRDEIRRDLQQRGYEVLPACPIPWSTPDFRQAVRADLARCTLSVHLIGCCAGIVPEGEEESIVAFQNGLAAEESAARFFPRLLWLPEGLEAKQKRQQDFIDRLLTGHSDAAGLELLRTPLEELKTVLQDKLNAKPPAPPPSRAERARVYLICHESDLDAVGAVRDALDQQGCDVDLPLFEGSEAERGEYHKELLRLNDAAVVYYGAASEAWLRFKLLDLRKAPGYREPAQPALVQAVYVAPPETPQKLQLKSHEPRLIRSCEPFLADLASRRV
jgi:hypothetical protein